MLLKFARHSVPAVRCARVARVWVSNTYFRCVTIPLCRESGGLSPVAASILDVGLAYQLDKVAQDDPWWAGMAQAGLAKFRRQDCKKGADSVSYANLCGFGPALRCCTLVLECEDFKRKFWNVDELGEVWRELFSLRLDLVCCSSLRSRRAGRLGARSGEGFSC
jgi:hypothetical protein